MTIVRAHAKGRPVGICGEAPSNHPEFATWLADLGIDSISLNPDALPECAERLAAPTAPTAPTDPTDPTDPV
jgi:pyruvate,water dikinase